MVEENQLLLGCLKREDKAVKINHLQDYTDQDWEVVLDTAL